MDPERGPRDGGWWGLVGRDTYCFPSVAGLRTYSSKYILTRRSRSSCPGRSKWTISLMRSLMAQSNCSGWLLARTSMNLRGGDEDEDAEDAGAAGRAAPRGTGPPQPPQGEPKVAGNTRTRAQPWSATCPTAPSCPPAWLPGPVLPPYSAFPLILAQPDRQCREHHSLLLPDPRCAGSRDSGPRVHVEKSPTRARSRTSGARVHWRLSRAPALPLWEGPKSGLQGASTGSS